MQHPLNIGQGHAPPATPPLNGQSALLIMPPLQSARLAMRRRAVIGRGNAPDAITPTAGLKLNLTIQATRIAKHATPDQPITVGDNVHGVIRRIHGQLWRRQRPFPSPPTRPIPNKKAGAHREMRSGPSTNLPIVGVTVQKAAQPVPAFQ